MHRCRKQVTIMIVPFDGNCADPGRCNPRAHGGTTTVDLCACGAKRRTNRTGEQIERGGWWPCEGWDDYPYPCGDEYPRMLA